MRFDLPFSVSAAPLWQFIEIVVGAAKNKGATVVGLSVAPDIMAVIFLTLTTA